jgi:SOS-response transcriptional repressor LexA
MVHNTERARNRYRNALRLRDEAGGPADFARAINKSSSQVSQFLSANPVRNIGDGLAHEIEDAFGLKRGWLDVDHQAGTGISVREPSHSIAITNAVASMGLGAPLPDHETVVDKISLSSSWVQKHLTVSSPGNLAFLTAYGDSMRPTFSDGDILLIDRGVNAIKIDAVYVLSWRNELFVKRLQRRMNGTLLVISDNPHYEPQEVKDAEAEGLEVLGRVVWAWNGNPL